MQDVTHPHHSHEHRVWVIPDSSLGRGASLVFVVATVVALAAPVLAWVTQHLVSPGAGTPWFFTLWGSTLVALVVATASAAVAAVALVRDHALLLLAPVAFAVVGLAALITTNGVLS
ncbi:MAG: hypothetical protein WBC76_09465 [Actinomycetes bacterium]|jgi:hypothetical protein